MKIQTSAVNVEQQLALLTDFRLRKFRTLVQWGITKYLGEVKYDSAKEILAGPTGLSPYASAKKQPPVAGRLTRRSGRLQWMLREDGRNLTWKGFGNKVVKVDRATSPSFFGSVKQVDNHFEAWWSVHILDGSAGLKNYKGKLGKAALKKSLAFRAMHERGLKGRAPRRYMAPAGEKNKNLPVYIQDNLQRHFNQWGK